MKISRFVIALCMISLITNTIASQEATDIRSKIQNIKLSTKEDSLSYALALLNYSSLLNEKITPDPLVFAKAIIDAQNGNAAMSDELARNFLMKFVNERQARQAELDKAAYKDYIEANEEFLLKNKGRTGVMVTPSGLQYEIVTLGTGPKPTRENVVKVHYSGKLIDGTEFDSSIKRNSPAQFPLSNVIPGWTEGLQLMPVGSKFIFYIPEKLGYGSRGAGETIKPYSTLIFEVELLDIVK